ncbi:hypothetical protein [Nonomuraea sp. LPB2021202275-12-8]
MKKSDDAELHAIEGLVEALEPLDDDTHARVVQQLISRHNVTHPSRPIT